MAALRAHPPGARPLPGQRRPVQARATGLPLLRHLALVYPDDPRAWEEQQEYMLGDDLLVAPVVGRAPRTASSTCPAGFDALVDRPRYAGPARSPCRPRRTRSPSSSAAARPHPCPIRPASTAESRIAPWSRASTRPPPSAVVEPLRPAVLPRRIVVVDNGSTDGPR